LFQLHECDIHAVCFGAYGGRVTKVRFCAHTVAGLRRGSAGAT
jgi:hypothetical protein